MTVGALPEVGNDEGFSGRGLIALGSAKDNLVHDMSVRTRVLAGTACLMSDEKGCEISRVG
jgi:hypothetical protein